MTQNYLGLKIVEFTGELGPYTTKLFADLGADVIQLEPIGGNPLRRVGPFYRNEESMESSLQHLYYNAGKRSLVLDLEQSEGRALLKRLCTEADLMVESFAPGYLESLGLSYGELSGLNPQLVQASVTPYGQFGPLSGKEGSDITCAAIGGFLHLAGVGDDKPVRTPDNQAYRMAEAYAAVGSAIALYHARRTGQGQLVDVAAVEAVGMALENSAQYWDLEKIIRRGRGKEAGSCTVHPCKDGYIVIVAILGKNKSMWEPFLNWMQGEQVEEADLFEDERWIDPAYRVSSEAYENFCRVFERYTREHNKEYLYEIGQHYKVSVTPVSNGKDLLENPQLKYRNYWQERDNAVLGGKVVYPGAPYEFGEMKWEVGGNAPCYGEHTREVLVQLGYSDAQIEELNKAGVVYAS